MIGEPLPPGARRFVDAAVMVTGAAGGIGSAICRRFAAEGARVVMCDTASSRAGELADELLAAGWQATAAEFDLSDADACAEAVEGVVRSHGRLDVLVNNAGINRRGDLLAIDIVDWEATFAVNLDAIFHLCRVAVPVMARAGGGAIVNTASQWGLHPAPAHIAYNTSKAAVVAFSRNLARDHAVDGVRVNAVCPGEIGTPMLLDKLAASGQSTADLDRLVPVGRIGRPEEVAALVAFLASEEAPFLTGSVVEITGAQAVA